MSLLTACRGETKSNLGKVVVNSATFSRFGKADFRVAYKYIRSYEGGYCDEPYDLGGVTYAGIVRKWNKNWIGWTRLPKNPKRFDIYPLMEIHATDYYVTLWVREGFMELNNQEIANYLFDMRINHSRKKTIEILNQCTNLHVKNQVDWVDSSFDRINLKKLRITRIEHYKKIAKRRSNHIFLKGWLKRANSQKP